MISIFNKNRLNLKSVFINKNKTIINIILIFLFYLLIIFVLFPAIFFQFSSCFVRGDLRNILSIISHSLNTSLAQIYHLPILYPESFVLAKTHPLFGVSIFFKLFEILGFNLYESINLYFILSLVLGAFGCYLLAKELSGDKFFSLLFSAIYIISPRNSIHFVWLNFLSNFYIPYIFFFFIKYFRTGRKKFVIAAVLFSFFQFLSSVYYGVLLWAMLIPVFLFFSLLLKIVSFAKLRFVLISLFLGFLLIVLVFHPFIIYNQTRVKHFDNQLIIPTNLFSFSKFFSLFFDKPVIKKPHLFLGFTFLIFVLIFFSYFTIKKKFTVFGILFFSSLLMGFLVYVNIFVMELFFLIFLCFLLFIIIKGWRKIDKWIKLILLTFSTFFLFMLKFPSLGLERSYTLFNLFYTLLPVEGLKYIKRAFYMILPLLIVFATIGASKWLGERLRDNSAKKRLVFLLILALMIIENCRDNSGFFKKGEYMESMSQDQRIYRELPFKKNKIILEIPYYFHERNRNGYYTLNWRFHQNYLLNGKISLRPWKYYRNLSKIIGKFQINFPTKYSLRRLIQDYSVNYIIIRWELLKKYAGVLKNPGIKEKMVKRIKAVKEYAEVIYDDVSCMVLKIQEYRPVKRIGRTYSYFHLRNNLLKIKLKSWHKGKVNIVLNGKLVQTIHVNDRYFIMNFKDRKLSLSGNRIDLFFNKRISLKDIEIF